jgi:hypothetical protein
MGLKRCELEKKETDDDEEEEESLQCWEREELKVWRQNARSLRRWWGLQGS